LLIIAFCDAHFSDKKNHEKRVPVSKVRTFLLRRGFGSLFWLESQWISVLIHDPSSKKSYLYEK
jgi:hypothetical protein